MSPESLKARIFPASCIFSGVFIHVTNVLNGFLAPAEFQGMRKAISRVRFVQ